MSTQGKRKERKEGWHFFCLPYLDELAEGCVGWVVSDQETHVLVGDFHRGWTVHNGKQNA